MSCVCAQVAVILSAYTCKDLCFVALYVVLAPLHCLTLKRVADCGMVVFWHLEVPSVCGKCLHAKQSVQVHAMHGMGCTLHDWPGMRRRSPVQRH